jgi:D-alanyl-D-alanine carboxypeptidase
MFHSSRRLIVVLLIVLVAVGGFVLFLNRTASAPQPAETHGQTSQPNTQKDSTSAHPEQPGDTFNRQLYSTASPSSLWVVVNKQRSLDPTDYKPTNLVVPAIPLRTNITNDEKYVRADNAKALKSMVDEAKQDSIHLNLQSGYRSYQFQVNLYNLYVKQQGQALADSQSARPGHSEHQTGLAADLGGTTKPSCNVEECFADTPEGKWLATNAYKYGYIIRYPKDKTGVTGYTYEPWHVRYVGTKLSEEMHQEGIETLEEFFGLPAAPDYK